MESESLEELRGKGSSMGVADEEEEDKLDVEADLSSSLLSIVMVEHGDDRAIPLECDDGSIAAMDTAHCNSSSCGSLKADCVRLDPSMSPGHLDDIRVDDDLGMSRSI